MKDFLKKMFSASPEVSHKRVLTVIFAFAILSFCYISTFTKYAIPDYMFSALCYLVAAGMGLTILDKWPIKPITKQKNDNEN